MLFFNWCSGFGSVRSADYLLRVIRRVVNTVMLISELCKADLHNLIRTRESSSRPLIR